MDPLPSLNRVFSMVLHHKRQPRLASAGFNLLEDSQVPVKLTDDQKITRKGRENYNRKVCTYCGKMGHTVDACYKKHSHLFLVQSLEEEVLMLC